MLATGLGAFRPNAAKAEDGAHKTEYAKNGDPVLSPSQLSTFLMCPRKWAARYIHGIPDPPAASAQDGVRMHKVLERYYNEGIAPDNTTKWGAWASVLLAKTGLPLPGPHIRAEQKFKFELDGVWWRGSKDLPYDEGEYRVIRDHKSTSGLEWAKTEDQLLTDPQSDIYAWDEYIKQDKIVRNDWGYVTREQYPKTLVVSAYMPFENVAHAMKEHTATGKRILQLYKEKPEINDLEPVGAGNGGCSAFSGCKIDGKQCRLSSQERLAAIRKHELQRKLNMSALDAIKARARAAAAAATTAAGSVAPTIPAAAPAPVAPVTPAAAVPAPVVPAAAAPAPAEPAAPSAAPKTVRAKLASAASVAPPAFTPPAEPPPAAVALKPAEQPRKVATGRAGVKKAVAPVPPTALNEDETGTYSEEEIRAVAAATGHSVNAPVVVDTTATPASIAKMTENFQVEPTVVAAMKRAVGPRGPGFELFVNCAPHDGYTLFSQYVAVVHAGVKEVKGTDLYNLLGFEGTAIYQDCLRQALEQEPPSGALVVDSRTNEGRDALSVLERHAYRVVRGF